MQMEYAATLEKIKNVVLRLPSVTLEKHKIRRFASADVNVLLVSNFYNYYLVNYRARVARLLNLILREQNEKDFNHIHPQFSMQL